MAAAMESFRLQGVDKLDDCEASIEMVKLINNLADPMNSNRPHNAMRLDSTQFEVSVHPWSDFKIISNTVLFNEPFFFTGN